MTPRRPFRKSESAWKTRHIESLMMLGSTSFNEIKDSQVDGRCHHQCKTLLARLLLGGRLNERQVSGSHATFGAEKFSCFFAEKFTVALLVRFPAVGSTSNLSGRYSHELCS